MYLLDTNVVSELRKGRRADANVLAWTDSVAPGALFISVIPLLEIEKGILLVERRDPAQGAMLRSRFNDQVQTTFAERTLVFDAKMALRCAELHVPDPRPERDSMIAACALASGFTVVTRNVSDFIASGVDVLNPWQKI